MKIEPKSLIGKRVKTRDCKRSFFIGSIWFDEHFNQWFVNDSEGNQTTRLNDIMVAFNQFDKGGFDEVTKY
jgi:hypothetical protein